MLQRLLPILACLSLFGCSFEYGVLSSTELNELTVDNLQAHCRELINEPPPAASEADLRGACLSDLAAGSTEACVQGQRSCEGLAPSLPTDEECSSIGEDSLEEFRSCDDGTYWSELMDCTRALWKARRDALDGYDSVTSCEQTKPRPARVDPQDFSECRYILDSCPDLTM